MKTTKTTCILIPAPGYHGDWVTVYATAKSIDAAMRTAKRMGGGVRILAGVTGHKKGDKIGRGVVQDMISAGHWQVV